MTKGTTIQCVSVVYSTQMKHSYLRQLLSNYKAVHPKELEQFMYAKWSLFARCSMHLQAWEWACFGFKQAAKGATGSSPKGNPQSTRDCKKARPSPTEAGWGGKGDVWGRMRAIWQWLITFILMIQIWTPIYKQWTLAFLSQDTWWENAKQRSLINDLRTTLNLTMGQLELEFCHFPFFKIITSQNLSENH